MSENLPVFQREHIETPLHGFTHQAMNCDWEIFIPIDNPEYARQAADAAFEEVDRIEADLSRFREGSDVRRLNGAAPGETVLVGPYARDCLWMAGEISEATQGAFDVMVGRAMDEVRAGHSSNATLLPGEPLLEIDPLRGAVTILGEGVAIDFGALGKGYAIDCLVQILREWSIFSALAHAGTSSVYALGTPPGHEGWPLALRDPRDQSTPIGTLTLRDAALGGSGFDDQGRHIIDPRTGQVAQAAIASWYCCENAARADAISTALMVMSPDECAEFLALHFDESGLVLHGDSVRPEIVKSGLFSNLELIFNPALAPLVFETQFVEAETKKIENPSFQSFIGRRVAIVFREQTRRAGILTGVEGDWLYLRSDEDLTLLIPREAVLWIEVKT